ncbi:MAG: response regulator [Candidatus Saccharimonas aalborgensis]
MTKILLVEDDKSLREIYGVRLLAEGYDIVSAGDGEEALAMAIKDRPDLIVSDVMMPKISGFDMLDILRSTTETKGIKVIMMTALSSEDQRKRGESLGADRYLVKSQVGIEDVVRTVHEVLGDAPITANTLRPASSTTSAPLPPSPAAPTSSPAPVAPVAPMPPAAPLPQPMVATPTPSPQPAPTLTQPQASPPPLPQPTAPFSTPRPATLGDRVIHPLQPSEPPRDYNNLMARELANGVQGTAAPVMPQPQAPTAPPIPTPPPTFSAPVVATPPAASGLSFEETPRPPVAPPLPTVPMPQSPTPPSNPVTPVV